MDNPKRGAADADTVAVLNERLASQERVFSERFASLDKVFAAESAAIKMALDLQAKEYERRLGELNNAHARAEKIATDTLTIERYEPRHAALVLRIDSQEILLHDLKTFADGLRSNFITLRTIIIAILVPFILFIAALLWALLTHKIEITS